MEKENIINTAIKNLNKTTGIKAKWKGAAKETQIGIGDGVLTIDINNNRLTFNVEVKQEFRFHQIEEVLKRNKTGVPLMIVATKLYPKIKDHLRLNHIAYLEANGNVYIEENETLIRVDGQKPIQTGKGKTNRAFTKAGIKLLFLYLTNQEWINRPYRDIAKKAKVALGTIQPVNEALKKLGYIVKLDEKTFMLVNKEELIKRWAVAYAEELKPKIKLGVFMLDKESINNWKNIDFIDENTLWGGEPAADILTNYLHPTLFTIYTTLNTNTLIRNQYLFPIENGQVEVYEKFWEFQGDNQKTAPPLIVYADLLNTDDNRNIETANIIYERYLKDI